MDECDQSVKRYVSDPSLPSSSPHFRIRGAVTYLRLAERGLNVLMAQTFANRRQTYAAVDQFRRVTVLELVQGAADSRVPLPAGLYALVTQWAARSWWPRAVIQA